ncbi:DNA repair protein XRCC2-like [Ciona intestinalis]
MASFSVKTHTPTVVNIGKFLFCHPNSLQDNVVEIIGEEACGKSTVLQHLMIDCILPKSHGGCEAAVLYFDLDGHLDLLRIMAIMEQKTEADESVIKLWLKRLFVVRCDSTEQVVITLHSIEPLIANSKVKFGMIILDSLTAFHWIDCQVGGTSQYFKEVKMRKVIAALKMIKERYKICVLASSQQLINVTDKNSDTPGKICLHKPVLPAQWSEMVNYRFVLKCNSSADATPKKITIHGVLPSHYEKGFVVDERGLSEI